LAPSSPAASASALLAPAPLQLGLGADVERLDDTGVHGRNDVHGAVQVFITDSGLPCVRKAALHSMLAVSHQGHRQTHERLFAL